MSAFPAPPTPPRFLSAEDSRAIYERVESCVAQGEALLKIISTWNGATRFSSNVLRTSRDVHTDDVQLVRTVNGSSQLVTGNQVDETSLRAMVRRAESLLQMRPETADERLRLRHIPPSRADAELRALGYTSEQAAREIGATTVLANTPEPLLHPKIFFDSTYGLDPAKRAAAVESLVTPATRAGMLAAGEMQVSAVGVSLNSSSGLSLYYPSTYASYSVTVRAPDGSASGWAGVNWNDWDRVDPQRLSDVALDKCLRSKNPVRVEPGRYTVILEPQAVWDLCAPVIAGLHPVLKASGKYALAEFMASKPKTRVIDERLTISQDPMDPDCGFSPFVDESLNPAEWGGSYYPATWIANGIVSQLPYDRATAIKILHQNTGLPNSGNNRMSGGATTIDEMIATSTRAIVVTRFSDVMRINPDSLLSTGYTRDGTWLVENGKITKPVKNFKFTDNPMFVLNKVEALGPPQRVFTGPGIALAVIVPPIKARDFNFVALTEAV